MLGGKKDTRRGTRRLFALMLTTALACITQRLSVHGFCPLQSSLATSKNRFHTLSATVRSGGRRLSTASTSSDNIQHQPSSCRATSPFLSVEECLELFQTTQASRDTLDSSSSNSGKNRVKFVDASWYHKGDRNGRDEFEQGPRIPGSQYFDLDDICAQQQPPLDDDNQDDSSVRLPPRMLPSGRVFAATMDRMGITANDHVVVYGKAGAYFTPRVWFTLGVAFGHAQTSLMQGTLEDWTAMGGPIETDQVTTFRLADLDMENQSPSSSYPVRSIPDGRVTSLDDIANIVMAPEKDDRTDDDGSNPTKTVLVDARGSSFAKKGHMPGAIHVPYASLVESDNSCRFKSREELRQILNDAGVPLPSPSEAGPEEENSSEESLPKIVCTCGTGVSACSLYLALRECGAPESRLSVYDGSWQEYKRYPHLPKVIPP